MKQGKGQRIRNECCRAHAGNIRSLIVIPDLTGIEPQPSGVCREGSPLDAAKIIRRFDPTVPIVFISSSNGFAAGTYNKRRVLYHLRCGTVIEGMETLSWASDKLLPYRCFVQPHRSYLVNLQHADSIEVYETRKYGKYYQIILQNRSAVPITVYKEHGIKQRFLEYQMGKG